MFERIPVKRAGLIFVACTFLYAVVSVNDFRLQSERLETTPHDKYSQKECSDNFCTRKADTTCDLMQNECEECLRDDFEVVFDRWIVTTTKSRRMNPFEKLTLGCWQLVVVSEDINSKNRHIDGIHFINVKRGDLTGGTKTAQKATSKMFYKKNAGYLYAIKNGAKYIYDADEDVALNEEGLRVFDYDKTTSGLWHYAHNETEMSERIFNPYQFFGSTHRGPREVVLHFKNHANAKNRLRLCRERPSAPVQHGMIRGESKRNPSNSAAEFYPVGFNKFAPHVNLAPGTFSMFSSSNTLFHYRAFFVLFVPASATSRIGMVLRSYFIQKLLHLIGDGIGFYPPNSMLSPNDDNFEDELVEHREVLPSAHEMTKFLESWKCNETTIALCSLSLAKEFRRRKLWSEQDVAANEVWINELEQLGYEFPAMSTSNLECAFTYNENTKGQNCRPVGIDFASSSHKSNVGSNLETASEKIEAFRALDTWCSESGYEANCNYPSPSQLALNHACDSTLTNNQDTVLVIINNYQRKRGMGLLQRLYQPYFGMTIFCGTWNPREHIDDGLYPEMIHPFNYIHVSAAEIVRGVFMYYCLSKVRELKLQNVRGYFISADDAIFHFWHELDLDEIQYPVWVIKRRYPSAWWLTEYGSKAARRAQRLFTGVHQRKKKVEKLWVCYREGLLAQGHTVDAGSHISDDNGWTLSDFFYIPQKKLAYLAEAVEVFFEANLFVELTMNKLLQTVSHSRIPQEKFAYVPKTLRDQWREYYQPDLIMIHPVKLNYFADLTNRTDFCETVVRSFGKALMQC